MDDSFHGDDRPRHRTAMRRMSVATMLRNISRPRTRHQPDDPGDDCNGSDPTAIACRCLYPLQGPLHRFRRGWELRAIDIFSLHASRASWSSRGCGTAAQGGGGRGHRGDHDVVYQPHLRRQRKGAGPGAASTTIPTAGGAGGGALPHRGAGPATRGRTLYPRVLKMVMDNLRLAGSSGIHVDGFRSTSAPSRPGKHRLRSGSGFFDAVRQTRCCRR